MSYGRLDVYYDERLTVKDFHRLVQAIADLMARKGHEPAMPQWSGVTACWEGIPVELWDDLSQILRREFGDLGLTSTFDVRKWENEG